MYGNFTKKGCEHLIGVDCVSLKVYARLRFDGAEKAQSSLFMCGTVVKKRTKYKHRKKTVIVTLRLSCLDNGRDKGIR